MFSHIKKICSCFRHPKEVGLVIDAKNSNLKHEMVKAHQDLASAKDEAQRKSIVINALSHDIRSPLNNINLQIQVALMYLDVDNEKWISGISKLRPDDYFQKPVDCDRLFELLRKLKEEN